jgi:hypothetical protein
MRRRRRLILLLRGGCNMRICDVEGLIVREAHTFCGRFNAGWGFGVFITGRRERRERRTSHRARTCGEKCLYAPAKKPWYQVTLDWNQQVLKYSAANNENPLLLPPHIMDQAIRCLGKRGTSRICGCDGVEFENWGSPR